jgi:hypothetical protein
MIGVRPKKKKSVVPTANSSMERHAEQLVRLIGDAVEEGQLTDEKKELFNRCFEQAAMAQSSSGADFGLAVQRAVTRLCSW